jgi:uncharacterized protein YjbJ (UPF0337 family)
MNWDRIEGKWKEVRGKVRERWGKLTDDDLDRIQGKREQLAGRLQDRYGWAREQVEREIRVFEETFANADHATTGSQGSPHKDSSTSRQADGAMGNVPRPFDSSRSTVGTKEREPAGSSKKY